MVHVLWLLSCWNDYQVQQASSAATDHTGIPLIWCVGFAVLACVNLFHLVQPPSLSHHNKFSLARVLMTIPLFVYMGLIAGIWFLGVEGHGSGQAIYLHDAFSCRISIWESGCTFGQGCFLQRPGLLDWHLDC